MIDTTINLIAPETRTQDARGVWRTTKTATREIMARVDSVDRTEFFSAGQAGFQPEFRFTVFVSEYGGEAVCEYEGVRYAIYRTYHVPGTDDLELYVRREEGVRGGVQNPD